MFWSKNEVFAQTHGEVHLSIPSLILLIARMTTGSTEQKFREVYSRWEQSGMNRAAFCKQEDLKYHWFMTHQKRMRRKIELSGFEQVSPLALAEKITPARIEFHYPDGRYFVFESGTPLDLIKQIAG